MSRRTSTALRYLGLVAPPRPATAGPQVTGVPRRRRGSRRRPHPLRWLGLAERPVRLAGHPRIRERALANLARRRRRDRAVTVSIGALLAMALLATAVVRSPLLAVEAVTVHGLDQTQRQAVTATLDVTPGTNVLDVDPARVEAQVEALPWVAAAAVSRRLPSTVEIRVATREPVAVAELDGDRWLLDADGVVLEQLDGGDPLAATDTTGPLPTVAVYRPPRVGETVSEPSARAAAAVAGAMPQALRAWVVGYDAGSRGEVTARLRLPTPEGPAEVHARLGRPEQIAEKAATLAALLEETVGRGGRPAELDVRIPDRPVVING